MLKRRDEIHSGHFSDLSRGAYFRKDEKGKQHIYIAINPMYSDDVPYNAIRLSDGTPHRFMLADKIVAIIKKPSDVII